MHGNTLCGAALPVKKKMTWCDSSGLVVLYCLVYCLCLQLCSPPAPVASTCTRNHTTIFCIFLELLQKPRSVHTLFTPSTTGRLFGPMPSHRGPHASITTHPEASAFVGAKNQDKRVSGSGGKDYNVLHVLRATGGMALGSLA